MQKYFISFCLIFLCSCASQQATQSIDNISDYQKRLSAIEQWQLRGKIVVLSNNESEKAKFTWQNTQDDYKIRLSGALGMGTTYIKGNQFRVRLEQNGKQPVEADTPEQLIYDQLGRDIPVSHLRYWVKGLPSPNSQIDQALYDEQGMIQQLSQDGWHLRYIDFSINDEWQLPSTIIAQRNDIELQFHINRWTIHPQ